MVACGGHNANKAKYEDHFSRTQSPKSRAFGDGLDLVSVWIGLRSSSTVHFAKLSDGNSPKVYATICKAAPLMVDRARKLIGSPTSLRTALRAPEGLAASFFFKNVMARCQLIITAKD